MSDFHVRDFTVYRLLGWLLHRNLSIIGSPLTDEPEATILNLNMLLYLVLFLIILALFLGSLARSRMGAGRSREDTCIPEDKGE